MLNRYRVQKNDAQEIDDGLLTLGESEVSRMRPEFGRVAMTWVFGCVCLVFLLFFGRLYYLNVAEGSYYVDRAINNKTREYTLTAPRGKILDRSGEVLVHNVPSTNIVAMSSYLPTDEEELSRLVDSLVRIFSLAPQEIRDAFGAMKKSRQPQVVLKRDAPREEVLRFLEQEDAFPGIATERGVRRQYEDSAIFSHVIGYEGKVTEKDLEQNPAYALNDSIGRAGIERSYESILRGLHGARRLEVDAFGRVQKEIASREPVPGRDLVLSIDAGLQKKLFDAMAQELEKSDLTNGAAVALDPRNGEVLALVSFPSYDNNVFSGSNNEGYTQIMNDANRPLFNRAISGAYPPGSTLKPMVAVAALEENIIDPNKQIESRGGISLGSFTFGDWKAHGFTDMRRAIAVSSDVFFYSIGGGYGDVAGMGIDVMTRYNKLFGLGVKTGIDLPGEVEGFLPSEQWKKDTYGEPWYVGNSYHASIGQGFITATPLQMAVATATVANGGTVWVPKIVSQIRESSGEVTMLPSVSVRSNIASPRALEIVREGMLMTVTEGTAQQLKDLPVEVAGKTGTAQFGTEDKTHGWFEAFAPYENPEIVLVVMVESQVREDTYNAVPVTREVLEWYFRDKKEGASDNIFENSPGT